MRPRRRGRSPSGLLLVGLVAFVAAAAFATVHWMGATPRPSAGPPSPAFEAHGKWQGRAAAPVSIEVYSDFLCSHCADLAATVEPALIAEFVRAGSARLGYRHFPVLGPLSQAAAEASECAVDQGRFWAYHAALFARARRGTLRGLADLDTAAREAGLDASSFRTCRQSGVGRARVAADRDEGVRRGVQGTPTTFVGGRMIVGAQDVGVFRAAIRDALPP